MDNIDDIMYQDTVNLITSTRPRAVSPASTSFFYYVDVLFRKAMSVYEFKNIPDNWDYDYFLSNLLANGFIAITDTKLGVLPLRCGISGVNVFNHPTTVNIANPVLGNLLRTIDVDCALVKIAYNYRGIMSTVYRYAEMLAACDSSIAVNLQNSKVTFIALVESKQQANSMKLMYDKISAGEPAVFVKGSQINSDTILYNHVKENFIAGDVQLLKRKIMSEFLTEIGVNNANTDKRERLTDNEVEANDAEIQLNAAYWLENIREGITVANNMFGLDITAGVKNVINPEGDINNANTNTVI